MLSLVERPPKVMAAGIMSNHITPSRNRTKKIIRRRTPKRPPYKFINKLYENTSRVQKIKCAIPRPNQPSLPEPQEHMNKSVAYVAHGCSSPLMI